MRDLRDTVEPTAPRGTRVPEGGRRLMRAVILCGASILFALSFVAANHVLDTLSDNVQLTASLLVLAGAVVAVIVVGEFFREVLYWRRPMRKLARLVNELRAGQAPITDLDEIVGGGAQALVEPIRSILLDLREQKRLNAELTEEMRMRILSRTDALERQLGAMKRQAARDPLTGLNNRRAFDELMPEVLSACRASHQDLCVLMVDVDHFKALNDTLGHAAGDEMLRGIAEIMRSSIRERDAAFRIGGDEFVLLLPRTSRDVGERLAQRLVSLVDHLAAPLRLPTPPALSVGVAGLAEIAADASSAELLGLADRRLYDAKSAKPGRRRRNAG